MSAAAVGVLALAGCSGSGADSVHIAPPHTSEREAALCTDLHGRLPARLDGRATVQVRPASPTTAAWGDPAVLLRCGVGSPRGFRPTSEVIEVNGVTWFPGESKSAYVFTLIGRQAFVELRVPKAVAREDATAPLVDLSGPVKRALPPAD